ncbi:LysM peptidoglycan-binding domain-containing protein [Tolypothrix campylonemoides VB511288]|nr:LysM peptidoglycan-binding domain-containing protein [Tolypothrix campylonemoides VB511288]
MSIQALATGQLAQSAQSVVSSQLAQAQSPSTHTVRAGESLEGIASRYGTTTDALLEANPQIRDPDLIRPGDTIALPPRSTQGEQVTSDIDTRFGTSNDEFTVEGQAGQNGGSVLVNPGDGAVGVEVNREHIPGAPEDPNATTPRAGGEFQATSRAAVTEYHTNEDGTTTYKLELELGSGFEASGQVGRGRAEGSYAVDGGFRGFYEVTLPDGNLSREASLQAATRINPFDPTTIPQDATVTLHGAAYLNTELAGSFRHLGTVTNVTEAGGVAIAVQRTGEDTVRVTAGPTQAVEAYNGVGLSFEQAQLMLGRQDNVGAATLRSAEFDLSTAEGRAAYGDFLRTGQAREGAGVSDVVTIEKLDVQSQTRIEAQLGPLSASIGGAENVGSQIRTTYADGSVAVTTNLQYSGNVPMAITQRFDASGNEILAQRRYSYTIEAAEGSAEFLNIAAAGDFRAAETGPVRPGDTVTVTFNESGMRQLVQQTQAYVANSPTASEATLLGALQPDGSRPSPSAFDFAVALGRNLNGSDYGLSSKLFNIASGSDPGGIDGLEASRIPMSLEVQR